MISKLIKFTKYGNSNVLIDLAQLQVFSEASLGLIIQYDPVLRLERRLDYDISNLTWTVGGSREASSSSIVQFH